MKKFLFLLVVSGISTLKCFAQTAETTSKDGGKFSIGLDVAAPTGNIGQFYSFGIGGSIKGEIPTATNLFFTLTGGYESFHTKSEFSGQSSSYDGYAAVKAGLKYYFNKGFFGEASAGSAIYTGRGGEPLFAYSGGIGYSFTGGFEAGARYEAWTKDGGTLGQAALRLAFRF